MPTDAYIAEADSPADVVIGQADMTSDTSNRGGSVGANTLYSPMGVYSDGTKLIVAEFNNHRVLIYNTIPTSVNATADVVIGQIDMTSNAVNQSSPNPTASTLYYPTDVY